MAQLIKLETEEELNELISTGERIIVDYFAEWCGPCKSLGQYLESMPDDVRMYKVDTSDFISHNVRTIPTLLKFEGGVEIGRHLGFSDPQAVNEFIK